MSYILSTVILVATILVFFSLARSRYRPFGVAQLVLRVLVALPLLGSAIVLHFLRVNEATSMLPPVFPAARFLVLSTGVLEILGAVGLFPPLTRRSAALGIAIMMVLIFPVNVFVAGERFGGLMMPEVPLRLAMQVVYILMVLLAGYGLPSRSNV